MSISSPKRVCAKATKTGQIDSQISFADFNLRLNSPTISPTTSSINPDTFVTLSSSQGAALKYKLVALSQTCTDSGWQTYSAGFLLQSGKRVCAKASKPGWADSHLAYRDFNIVELSAFDSKTTTIPSDETFSERNAPQFDSVGFVTGNASVHGGAASYSIPLELPPGRAGVQPNLSLSYSSRSGNSTIGTGWAFSGGSSITRCGSTLAQDGYVQNPQYQSDDKLCLDGQRLIADKSDVYGQSGTVYYTEMDTFTRVTQSGSLNTSSASFSVEYKNGDIAYFGKTSSSRLVHQGKSTPYTWFIDYKHDSTAKNYINYKYQTFGVGEKLLTELNYTANSPSSSGIQSVKIEYEDKNNKSFGYISGGKYSSTKRIQRIDMLSGGNINTSYRLDYNSSVKTDNLEKIWKCFADYCLEPTSVTWSGEDDNFRLMPLGTDKTPFLIRDAQHLSLELPRGDANGDGVRDWKNKFINAEGEETGSFTANFEQCRETIFTGQLVCFSADFDQDGMSDEWEVVNNYLRITYSGGGSYYTNVFIPSDSVITGMKNRIVDIADYNGDSYPDLMVFTAQSSSNVKLTLYVHSKNKTAPYPQGKVVYNYPTISTSGVASSTRLTRSIEFNGDLTGNGLPDLIVTENEAVWNGQSYVQPIPDQILKNSSTPSSIRFDSTDLNLVSEKNYLNQIFSYFADVNGDSLPDWVGWESGDFVLRLNKGNGIFTASQPLGVPIVPSRTVQLVIKDKPYTRYQPIFTGAIKVFDIDNDGRMELLVPGRIAVEGCASIMNEYKEETWCGNEIYSKTWRNSRGGVRAIG